MKNLTILLSVAASLVSAAPAADVLERQVIGAPCTDVRVFLARGTGEGYPASANRMARLLVPAICKGRASCDYADIPYPATSDGDYCGHSEQLGVIKATAQITNHMKVCPGTKMVLAGYSQGAEVIGDVLGGTQSGTSCHAGNGPLSASSAAGKAISAVVLFADITRAPGQKYDIGSAGAGPAGRFGPRGGASLQAMNAYAGRIASYCDANDYWCASGNTADAGQIHGSSVEHNYAAAAAYVRSKL